MSDKRNKPDDKVGGRLKTPSPIGSQQSPVSNPGEKANRAEEKLAEREKFQREQEAWNEEHQLGKPG